MDDRLPIATRPKAARYPTGSRRRPAQGFVLVLALILLLVLTTLAISGSLSSSVGFVSAGNSQFQSNAFQAAEAGITSAMVGGAFDPTIPPQVLAGAVPNSPNDNYSASIVPALGGAAQPAAWGNSVGQFVVYDFDVQSTGTSSRGSTAVHTQGVQVLSPASQTTTGPGGLH